MTFLGITDHSTRPDVLFHALDSFVCVYCFPQNRNRSSSVSFLVKHVMRNDQIFYSFLDLVVLIPRTTDIPDMARSRPYGNDKDCRANSAELLAYIESRNDRRTR